MGVRVTSTIDFDKFFDIVQKTIHEELSKTLAYLGEQCVARIRDRSAEDSWIDRTGNLRSSIGYAVYDYGKKVVESSFESVLNGSTGSVKGKRYVDSLASQYADTLALVVVAGMDYAEHVEAIDSKDVLASTELWAKSVVERYVNEAMSRAEKKVNSMKW
jgi:hypothetical protein